MTTAHTATEQLNRELILALDRILGVISVQGEVSKSDAAIKSATELFNRVMAAGADAEQA